MSDFPIPGTAESAKPVSAGVKRNFDKFSVYSEDITVAAAATTVQISMRKPVQPGSALRINRVVIFNATSSSTSLTVSVSKDGHEIVLGYQDSPAANYTYIITKPFWVGEGERLTATFTGATAADIIHLNVFGELYEVGS